MHVDIFIRQITLWDMGLFKLKASTRCQMETLENQPEGNQTIMNMLAGTAG